MPDACKTPTSPSADPLRRGSITGLIAGLAALLLTITLSAIWMARNPGPVGWDEAMYLTRFHDDVQIVRQNGLAGLACVAVRSDQSRPSAFRLLALPLTMSVGVDPTWLRVYTLGFFCLALGLVCRTGMRAAGPVAGGLALAAAALWPQLIRGIIEVGTEYPLYLAAAALLYFVVEEWKGTPNRRMHWLGAGVALGLGAWSKASFLIFGGSVVLAGVLFRMRRTPGAPSVRFWLQSTLLGVLLASPWWILNGHRAVAYAQFASNFTRHGVGGSFWQKLASWPMQLWVLSAGPAIGIVLIGTILVGLAASRRRSAPTNATAARSVAVFCLLTPLPLMVSHILGSNHNMRLISVGYLPVAIAFGVLAVDFIRRWPRFAGAAIAAGFAAQGAMLAQPLVSNEVGLNPPCSHWWLLGSANSPVAPSPTAGSALFHFRLSWNPVTVFAPRIRRDLDRIRTVLREEGCPTPRLAYFGGDCSFNAAQLVYVWRKHGQTVDCRWLWRHEEGRLSWDAVDRTLQDRDVVIVARHIAPDCARHLGHRLDFVSHDEVTRRLASDAAWRPPVVIDLGAESPDEFLLFLRRNPLGKTASAPR